MSGENNSSSFENEWLELATGNGATGQIFMDKHFVYGAPYRLKLNNGESIEGTVLRRKDRSLELEIKSEQRTIDLEDIDSVELISFGPGQ